MKFMLKELDVGFVQVFIFADADNGFIPEVFVLVLHQTPVYLFGFANVYL